MSDEELLRHLGRYVERIVRLTLECADVCESIPRDRLHADLADLAGRSELRPRYEHEEIAWQAMRRELQRRHKAGVA